MQQIKFYRTPTLPTASGDYEVGSLYFYHNDIDGYNELYLCKSKTDSGYEFENYSGNSFWESSWEDTSGGGSGSGNGSGNGGDSPVIPDSGTITNVGDGTITVDFVKVELDGSKTTRTASFNVNQSYDDSISLSLEDFGGVSHPELAAAFEGCLQLGGGYMHGPIGLGQDSDACLNFGSGNMIRGDYNGIIIQAAKPLSVQGELNVSEDIEASKNIAAAGSITASEDIAAVGNITSEGDITTLGNLGVTKNIIVGENVVVEGGISAKGNVNAAAFYETSDARKKDIKSDLSLDKCYDLIDKCQTVIYSLKDQTQEQVGMIAQEIEEFFPEVVATDADGFKSLAYDRLVVICFKVLKDVIKRLEKLES